MFEVDLFKYLRDNENIPLRDRMEIAIEIGRGIESLLYHRDIGSTTIGIHHLDLKPSNIYLKTKDGKRHGRNCIADSGVHAGRIGVHRHLFDVHAKLSDVMIDIRAVACVCKTSAGDEGHVIGAARHTLRGITRVLGFTFRACTADEVAGRGAWA